MCFPCLLGRSRSGPDAGRWEVREAAGAPFPLPVARPGAGARRRGLPGNGRSPPATCAGCGGRGQKGPPVPVRIGAPARDPWAVAEFCPPPSGKLRKKRGGDGPRRESGPSGRVCPCPRRRAALQRVTPGEARAASPARPGAAAGSWGPAAAGQRGPQVGRGDSW